MNRCISGIVSNFHTFSLQTVSGMQIAFLVASSIFPVNRFAASKRQFDSDVRPGDGGRQEYNNETYIHSRLVSHSARAPSVDDIPVYSIRTLAGALVSVSYFVS